MRLRPESAQENENLDVILADTESPERMFRIRQITGQFARQDCMLGEAR